MGNTARSTGGSLVLLFVLLGAVAGPLPGRVVLDAGAIRGAAIDSDNRVIAGEVCGGRCRDFDHDDDR